MDPLHILLAFYALMSLAAFFVYGLDKRRAVRDAWRVPERTLLALAACGGAAGALLAMAAFRHKTRKKKFTFTVPALLCLQAALAVWTALHFGA